MDGNGHGMISLSHVFLGVLLSVILTTGESRGAYLLVLDAKTLKEIGRAETDARIGRDTHGMFVSGF